MALGSLAPGAAGAASDVDMNHATHVGETSVDQFIKDWGKYYQTANDPAKIKQVTIDLNRWDGKTGVPPNAIKAMEKAAKVFEGDHGATSAELLRYLTLTGYTETKFKTKVQQTNTGTGPARSYWQVEPDTAYSLVHDSFQYFGTNFRKAFPDRKTRDGKTQTALQFLQSLDKKQWSQALEQSDQLGAVMAAAKWIVTKYRLQNKK